MLYSSSAGWFWTGVTEPPVLFVTDSSAGRWKGFKAPIGVGVGSAGAPGRFGGPRPSPYARPQK